MVTITRESSVTTCVSETSECDKWVWFCESDELVWCDSAVLCGVLLKQELTAGINLLNLPTRVQRLLTFFFSFFFFLFFFAFYK